MARRRVGHGTGHARLGRPARPAAHARAGLGAGPLALNRPLLAVAGGSLLVILASLGALAYLQLRTGPLARRLIPEANALERATYPRPAHVPSPSPGTFGQAVVPLLDEVLNAYKTRPRLDGSAARECRKVSDGKVEPRATQADCLGILERDRALLARVLAATHTASGGLPEDLGIPRNSAHPLAHDGLNALLHMVRLAALETRLLLLAGRAEAAVDTCVDALALGREVTLGAGLRGRTVASAAHDLLHLPCAAALDAASAERRRRAAAQLVTLREGLPPFSRSVHEEATDFQLLVYASVFFDEEDRGALAPRSARMVQSETLPAGVLKWSDVLALRLDWRRSVAALDRMMAVADLPESERRRAFDTVAAHYDRFWPPLLRFHDPHRGTLSVPMFQEAADLVERQRLQLDALLTQAGAPGSGDGR